MKKLPEKLPHVVQLIRKLVSERRFVLTLHAQERAQQRDIKLLEMTYVLLHTGWHNSAKDQRHAGSGDWRYTIDGQTLDGRNIRVVVAVDASRMVVVITLINLEQKSDGRRPENC